jgi:dissimilatory sulfite reductase (desulfoviridin) alpha/beta subunit
MPARVRGNTWNIWKQVKGYQIETCFGPGGCPNRAVVDNELAQDLEERLGKKDLKSFPKKRVAGFLRMHHEFRVSISGCPNACSRPQIVDVGLIGACTPELSSEECSGCGACEDICKENAIFVEDGKPRHTESKMSFLWAMCVGLSNGNPCSRPDGISSSSGRQTGSTSETCNGVGELFLFKGYLRSC